MSKTIFVEYFHCKNELIFFYSPLQQQLNLANWTQTAIKQIQSRTLNIKKLKEKINKKIIKNAVDEKVEKHNELDGKKFKFENGNYRRKLTKFDITKMCNTVTL